MDFGWMESLLYGVIMGFSEVLPVSAAAHSRILLKFMGRGEASDMLKLLVRLGILAALLLSCQPQILKMVRAQKMSRIPKRKRKRPLDTKSLMDLHLLYTMLLPVILVMMVWKKLGALSSNLIIAATLLFLNGLILYIPQFLPSSNRDSRSLSRVEGFLMGLGGCTAAIPGLSGMGAALSVASVTGVERKYGLTMILLMNVGVLTGEAVYDLVGLVSTGLGGLAFSSILFYLLAAAASFVSAWLAIRILRSLAENKGYGSFAYYSWGLALFTFVLSLMA